VIYDAQLVLMTEHQCLLMLMISNFVMDQIDQTPPAPADSAKLSVRLVVATHVHKPMWKFQAHDLVGSNMARTCMRIYLTLVL